MLVVTTTAKEKLQEVLERQTTEPEVALRVTPTHNRLELLLDRAKRGGPGGSGKKRHCVTAHSPGTGTTTQRHHA